MALYQKSPVLRFEWKGFFIAFIVDILVTTSFSSIINGAHRQGLTHAEKTGFMEQLDKATTGEILLAGFEDCAFVLPLHLLSPEYRVIFASIMSPLFIRGHSYQGESAMWAKIPYIATTYILSLRYGILTTVAAHAIRDLMAISGLKVLFKIIQDEELKGAT